MAGTGSAPAGLECECVSGSSRAFARLYTAVDFNRAGTHTKHAVATIASVSFKQVVGCESHRDGLGVGWGTTLGNGNTDFYFHF